MPVQTVTMTSSGSRPAVTAHRARNCWHHARCYRCPGSENSGAGQFSCAVTPPRPLRTGEQTAALWIAPYIDNQDVYHQPSTCFLLLNRLRERKPY
ncbi:type IV conjugative transfer system lipoprotein TraV [Escherichia coli]|nr:type IV conjugative transfer system lipoprotein TraV [Escherichia coli]MCD9241083.1 type IV conjugative transfer system lipoprotein TraV [Escherichia coli]